MINIFSQCIAIIILIFGIIISIITRESDMVDKSIYTATGGNNKQSTLSLSLIILPTQLFEDITALKNNKVYLIEDDIYFMRYKYHKSKLVLHRASMKYYYDYLKKAGINVNYIEAESNSMKNIKESIITMYDPVDWNIRNKYEKIFSKVNYINTPYFLTTKEELDDYYKNIKKDKNYSHDSRFYRWQRRRLNILMKGNKPEGGEWTYDDENRNKFPENIKEPVTYPINNNKYVEEAIKYVEEKWPENPGKVDSFIYPVTHDEAKKQLEIFIKKKFKDFGKYQDAVDENIAFGYHSVISSSLNTGLLTPRFVLDSVLSVKNVPINSLEGYIRQLIGWREYCRLIYEYEADKLITSNYFENKNKLTGSWWNGTTGIEPIDAIIKRVDKYAYAHHIERLMYLSAIMLMCMVEPKEVFDWFISFVSIDAYDWVMVPNIYGMGTYADGGIMMSRPYFSSYNYVKKMSTKDSTNEKSEGIWNALYYNFIGEKQKELSKNYYTARWIGNYKKKSKKEKEEIAKIAGEFLQKNIIIEHS